MAKKYIIKLSDCELKKINAIIKKGTHNARIINRARVILLSHQNVSDVDIALTQATSERTVQRIRKRYCEKGLDNALYDNPRPGHPPALNNEQEAYLVAIACSDPPKGQKSWTIKLLKKQMIKDKIVIKIGTGTIHNYLKERGIKPWREKNVVCSQT